MDLQYRNGVRISKLPHEMSPLELSISRYEELAKEHYSKSKSDLGESLSKNEKTMTVKQRQERYESTKAHLESERKFLDNEFRNIKTMGTIQAQLKLYREEGMKTVHGTNREQRTAIKVLRYETHHNDKDLRMLEDYMRVEGRCKPTSYHTPHHILLGKGQYEQIALENARIHMHLLGVRINDPANGVYLVTVDANTPDCSMPDSCGHLRYHTKAYEKYVSRRVQQLNNIDIVKTELQVIGRLLQQNEPKAAMKEIGQLSSRQKRIRNEENIRNKKR